MEIRDDVYLPITILVNIIASYVAYVSGPSPVEGVSRIDVYRIFYIHTPAAWVCYLTLGISLLASILFLAKRNFVYDTIAEVSAILGLTYGAVALMTGSIWANVAWGVYWNWDPRETTTIILWIAYMGYISLRLSIGNVEKRASTGAVYNILAFSTVPLSYLSIRLWQSLHPQLIVPGSTISATPPVMETLFLNLIAASLVYIFLLRMMYGVSSLRKQVDALTYGKGG
ncbi:MAG: cytochrome c biogenesis protein [Candidatus Bathyarchaeia archaeon]